MSQPIKWFKAKDPAGDAHWGIYCEECAKKEPEVDTVENTCPPDEGYCTGCGRMVKS